MHVSSSWLWQRLSPACLQLFMCSFLQHIQMVSVLLYLWLYCCYPAEKMPMLPYSSAFGRMEHYGPLTYLDATQSIKPFPNSIYPDHMPSSHINIITGLTDNLEEAALSSHLCVGSGVKVRLLSMYHLVASAFTIGQSGHSSSSYVSSPSSSSSTHIAPQMS